MVGVRSSHTDAVHSRPNHCPHVLRLGASARGGDDRGALVRERVIAVRDPQSHRGPGQSIEAIFTKVRSLFRIIPRGGGHRAICGAIIRLASIADGGSSEGGS